MNHFIKFAAALLLAGVLPATAVQAQTIEYIHTDALGSVVAVSDANGNVIERREYEPYGLQLAPAVKDGPGYTGHVQDKATGLTYMQQRYYDPVVGRFLSVDPVAAREGGDNFNRYAYAANNPYKFTDPDGRDVVFSVDKHAAGGNGHTSLYFQDEKGNWSKYDQGAAGETSSGGNLGYVMGQDAPAGVSIIPADKSAIPADGVRISTTAKQDGLISASAVKSAEAHNSGKVEYNLYSNNCTDAAVDVVNDSGAGITVANPATTVKPNTWIQEVKRDPEAIKK